LEEGTRIFYTDKRQTIRSYTERQRFQYKTGK